MLGKLDKRRICADYIVLEYLGVNPDFRRRGVGETLVAWGIKQADEQGINVSPMFLLPGNALPSHL